MPASATQTRKLEEQIALPVMPGKKAKCRRNAVPSAATNYEIGSTLE
jgi:hypothetical protein